MAVGLAVLRRTRARSKKLYLFIAAFSFVANLLMLTGPLYMLQVYDRVLSSRSEETLVALTVLIIYLYAIMGLLDYARTGVLARIGARFQSDLDEQVFKADLKQTMRDPNSTKAAGLRDLEAVQRAFTSSGVMALYDLPWTPIFLVAIYIFHPLLGALALAGGTVLVLMALANQALSSAPLKAANNMTLRAETQSYRIRTQAETVQALGMRGALFERWKTTRQACLKAVISAADVRGAFSSTSKAYRIFLQSAILGLGAYLVLQDALTAGGMIAASILLGRALHPLDQVIAQWPVLQSARQSWSSLALLLSQTNTERPRTRLRRPEARLEVQSVSACPPGTHQPAFHSVDFTLEPGQVCGVVGPSGSGKSSLARTVAGIWKPATGRIRLGGINLSNYDPDILGSFIGYLPQNVQLFEGTIAENIARMSVSSDPEMIEKAARQAAVHDMILDLPDGYDTQLTVVGAPLSGGQVQRVGLARAMYGDPVLLVLDEPDSNLDKMGGQALRQAIQKIKASGKAALIMSHRPTVFHDCDVLLMLQQGRQCAFGSKDELLGTIGQHQDEIRSATAGEGT
jgi:PrtD family type I secretion system ABC transporter